MPLALEHWPSRYRGLASGLLQGGWYWGFILSALTFHFVYPVFSEVSDPFSHSDSSTIAWRVMLWIGVIPALLVLWLRSGVSESPVWLARQKQLAHGGYRHGDGGGSLLRLFRGNLLATTIQTSLLMIVFMCSYYSITFWHPTFLLEFGRDPLGDLIAFNGGAIVGTAAWGRASEGRLGRRGAVTLSALIDVAAVPLFLAGQNTGVLWLGALIMGGMGAGIWGMAPAYLTERFPTGVRGVGPGLSYHVGAAVGSLMRLVLGQLQDLGMTLTEAMQLSIVASGLTVALMIWLGPETRGRALVGFN